MHCGADGLSRQNFDADELEASPDVRSTPDPIPGVSQPGQTGQGLAGGPVGPGYGGREKSPLTSLEPGMRLAKVVPVREGEVTARSEAKERTKKREKKI